MQTQSSHENKINRAIQHVANHSDEKDLTIKVNVSKEKRHLRPLNPFVIIFLNNLREIIKQYGLNTSELVLLTLVLEKMEYGNLVAINQSKLAEELEISRQAVNKIFKKFKQNGLFITGNDGSLYVNSQVIVKGKLWDHKELEEVYQIALETSISKGLTKSF